MKTSNVLAAIFFAYATWVQLNDPDAARWILLYGSACAAAVLAAMGRLPWPCSALIAAVSVVPGLAIACTLQPEGPFLDDERAREMLGTLLVTVWSTAQGINIRRQR